MKVDKYIRRKNHVTLTKKEELKNFKFLKEYMQNVQIQYRI